MKGAKAASTPTANHFFLSSIMCPKKQEEKEYMKEFLTHLQLGVSCMQWFVPDQTFPM